MPFSDHWRAQVSLKQGRLSETGHIPTFWCLYFGIVFLSSRIASSLSFKMLIEAESGTPAAPCKYPSHWRRTWSGSRSTVWPARQSRRSGLRSFPESGTACGRYWRTEGSSSASKHPMSTRELRPATENFPSDLVIFTGSPLRSLLLPRDTLDALRCTPAFILGNPKRPGLFLPLRIRQRFVFRQCSWVAEFCHSVWRPFTKHQNRVSAGIPQGWNFV